MAVVYACEDAAEGSTKMDEITLAIEKATCRLRCAQRAIENITEEKVEDAVCVMEEVAACLGQVLTECSDMTRLCHFYLPPALQTGINDAVGKYLETVEGEWPDRCFCTQAFIQHSIREGLRGKDAIAAAVAAWKARDAKEDAERRGLAFSARTEQSSGRKKASGK